MHTQRIFGLFTLKIQKKLFLIVFKKIFMPEFCKIGVPKSVTELKMNVFLINNKECDKILSVVIFHVF